LTKSSKVIRRTFIFPDDVEDILSNIPRGGMTDLISKAIKFYVGNNMAVLETREYELVNGRERIDVDLERVRKEIKECREREDELAKIILRDAEIRPERLSFDPLTLDDPYPLLMKHKIKRSRRDVLKILEGME